MRYDVVCDVPSINAVIPNYSALKGAMKTPHYILYMVGTTLFILGEYEHFIYNISHWMSSKRDFGDLLKMK